MKTIVALLALILSVWLCQPTRASSDTIAATEQPQVEASTTQKAALTDWNSGKSKQTIISFVEKVTDRNSAAFVPIDQRIAVFDNDGTLICEKPSFFQVLFTREMALSQKSKHPEWSENAKIAGFLQSSDDGLQQMHGMEAIKLGAQCRAGLSEDEYTSMAEHWLATAKHPKFNTPYQSLTYQPMLQLMSYLKDNGFRIFICSGATSDFIRCYSAATYGVHPEQIIGSTVKLEFKSDEKNSALIGLPDIDVYNVGHDKPISIFNHIGRRPIIAVGNSNADMAMLSYATDCSGPALGVLVHHDDAAREYSYDRGAEAALKAANQHGWLVVSMKDDFKSMFPSAK